jgi:hypothetical protein
VSDAAEIQQKVRVTLIDEAMELNTEVSDQLKIEEDFGTGNVDDRMPVDNPDPETRRPVYGHGSGVPNVRASRGSGGFSA